MPILDLKLNQDLTTNAKTADWSVVGAATAVGALSDGSGSSYLRLDAFRVLDQTDDRLYGFSTLPLATNQAISQVRLRVGMLQFDSPAPIGIAGLATVYTYSALGGGNGFSTDALGHYFPLGSTFRGPFVEAALDPGMVSNPDLPIRPFKTNPCQKTISELDQPVNVFSSWYSALDNNRFFDAATINAMRVLFTMRGTSGFFFGGFLDARWSEIALEVDVRTQPTVSVFSSVGTTLGATVNWASTMNDGDVQSSWQLAVFTQSQAAAAGFDPGTAPAVYRASGPGTGTSAFVAAPLQVGATYVAFVRVAKKLGTLDSSCGTGLPPRTRSFFSQWSSNTIFVTPVDTATYTAPIPNEGLLGCQDWRVYIQKRGGGTILAEVPWQQLRWDRRLQEVSEASVTFARNGRFLTDIPVSLNPDARLNPWEHELAVWRDSEIGPVNEWVGPVTGIQADRDNVTIRARDWFTLMEHRTVHGDISLFSVELATIFAAIVQDALSVDNGAGVVMVIHSTGILADRSVLSTQYRRSADVLRELGRAGVEWTMVGRNLLAGGTEFGIPALRTLIDFHVREVSGEVSGEAAANDVTVIGRSTQNQQIVATDAVADPARGVLETVINTSDIQDSSSASGYAISTLALLSGTAPARWRMTLDDQAQSGYGRLIPGARVPVNLASVGLLDTLRLRQMSVSASRQPDGQTDERCEVELTTLGGS